MSKKAANVKLFSWNSASEGAKHLSQALGIKRLKESKSLFKGASHKAVINWGRSIIENTEILKCQVVNRPENVARVSNKLHFYELLSGKFDPDLLVPWTKDLKEAISWLTKPGISVFARTKLQGSGGEGIVEMSKDDPDSFVKAQLYTRYVPKSDEFRVHVMGGNVILVQRKGLRQTDDQGNPVDPKTVNWKIRNLSNGFVFVRSDVRPPAEVVNAATGIFPHLGLDFYAADVIWNEKQGRAYVLEVNTAPGLSGSTIGNYVDGFKTLLNIED